MLTLFFFSLFLYLSERERESERVTVKKSKICQKSNSSLLGFVGPMQFLNLDFVVPFLTGQVGVVASDRIPFGASRYISCAMDGAPPVISFLRGAFHETGANNHFHFFLRSRLACQNVKFTFLYFIKIYFSFLIFKFFY